MVTTNMKIMEVRDRALEDRKRNKSFFSADRSSGLDMNAVLDERVIDMQHCRQFPHHRKVATMHKDGYVLAKKYFAIFSSSLIDCKLEAEKLWEQIIEGDLKAPAQANPEDFSHDYMHFAGPNKLEQYQQPLSGEVHSHLSMESKTDRTFNSTSADAISPKCSTELTF